jgi:DNA excision repair protein ERCC-2
VARFCPDCGTALHPAHGCRKCSGAYAKAQAKNPEGPGEARFTGRRGGYNRTSPGGVQRGQARLGSPGATTKTGSGGTMMELVSRSSSRWKAETSGGPHPALGLFPFDEVRDGQRAFARDVARTVQRGGLLVAHAPTGTGKTAASMAPALEHVLKQGKKLLFLTSKQSQHHVVVETLRRIVTRRGARFAAVDVISKRDMCPREEKTEVPAFAFMDLCARLCRTKQCRYFMTDAAGAVEETRSGIHHVEELVDISLNHECCPHKVAMEAAKEADVVVCDYNYLFSDMKERILDSFNVEPQDLVVVVDEAHNLPDRVRSNFSLELTPFVLKEAEAEARRAGQSRTADWCRALGAHLDALAQTAGSGEELVLSKRELIEPVEQQTAQATITGEVTTGKDTAGMLTKLAEELTKDGEPVARSGQAAEFLWAWLTGGKAHGRILRIEDEGSWRLVHTLLDPGEVAGKIFESVHAAVVMSGTLYPPGMYRDLLGLDPERTRVKVYASPFDPSRRPVYCIKGTTSKYTARGPEMDKRMAQVIVDAHRAAGNNTAAFAISYDQLNRLAGYVEQLAGDAELIIEERGMSKKDRDDVLDTLRGATRRGGALLLGVLGGSLSEGVDYHGNLLSAISVCGLPLAPPGREVDLLIEHNDRRFPGKGRDYAYEMPALGRVLQAAGRAIRGEEDRAVILLLDERFMWPRYQRGFPEDFRPRMVDEPRRVLQTFFGA